MFRHKMGEIDDMNKTILTPELDHTFPSTTHLAGVTQFTAGPIFVIVFHALLFVVTFFRSRTPARAAIPAPVHTVIRYLRLGYTLLTYSICVLTSRNVDPGPPGTIRTSISSGGLSYVCVGFILNQKLEFLLLSAGRAGSIFTGPMVGAMSARLSWNWKARYQRGLRGPTTSMESKEGKRVTAKFLGGGTVPMSVCS